MVVLEEVGVRVHAVEAVTKARSVTEDQPQRGRVRRPHNGHGGVVRIECRAACEAVCGPGHVRKAGPPAQGICLLREPEGGARLAQPLARCLVTEEEMDVVIVASNLAEPSFRIGVRMPSDDLVHVRDLLEERALPAQHRHGDRLEVR